MEWAEVEKTAGHQISKGNPAGLWSTWSEGVKMNTEERRGLDRRTGLFEQVHSCLNPGHLIFADSRERESLLQQ